MGPIQVLFVEQYLNLGIKFHFTNWVVQIKLTQVLGQLRNKTATYPTNSLIIKPWIYYCLQKYLLSVKLFDTCQMPILLASNNCAYMYPTDASWMYCAYASLWILIMHKKLQNNSKFSQGMWTDIQRDCWFLVILWRGHSLLTTWE